MPKKLILVRHAKSDHSTGLKDFDRPLNAEGHRVAPRMGNTFAQKNIPFDAIISSPALRAKTTADYFAEQLKYDFDKIILNENIYEASVRVLLNEICALDDKLSTVLLFGHNPGFSYLAESLTKAEIGDMPTCAVIIINFETNTWKDVAQGSGFLFEFDYPGKSISEE
ncbi:MAG: histidine phosphatase family protein [Cytophagales bacterium]|nr:MAG: histidine phosphatase family protein [Cytophagales bacterium]